jgi:HK97 gp10 family phage protein
MTQRTAFKIGVEGASELGRMFKDLQDDFGYEKTKPVLVAAAKRAMRPALSKAKQLAPKDTEELAKSLQVEGRKPNRRDRKSVYVKATDAVVAFITTAPKKKLIKIRKAMERKKAKREGRDFNEQEFNDNAQRFDARAIAQEFGTAKHPAKPYLRPALESTAPTVIESLGRELKLEIMKYRMKNFGKLSK